MALFVQIGVERQAPGAGGAAGNDGLRRGLGQAVAEVIGIVGRVGNDDLKRQAGNEVVRLRDVVGWAGGQREADRAAQAIDGEMDLAGQAAARAADGLSRSPPFAPAAC